MTPDELAEALTPYRRAAEDRGLRFEIALAETVAEIAIWEDADPMTPHSVMMFFAYPSRRGPARISAREVRSELVGRERTAIIKRPANFAFRTVRSWGVIR